MVEKEERIYIGFINPEGDACPVPYGKCNSLCDNCQGGMTRTEAINRMAKEIARQYDPRKPNKEGYEKVWKQELFPATKKYYLKQAECVLNALLEGK